MGGATWIIYDSFPCNLIISLLYCFKFIFRFALDLYKNKLLEIELQFTNPFSFTTMLNYNPKIQVNRKSHTL